MGKSRLVEEFRAWCARRGAATADARCYPAEGPLAYGPVAAWLRSEALRSRLPRLDPARLIELARLLPELLIKLPDLQRPGSLPESDQRQLLFDAVSAAVRAAAPVLLTVDDLQRGDRETCQLLHYLLRDRPDARVLVVATARGEDIEDGHPLHELLAGLHARERLGEIELTRLSRSETAALAAGITGAPLTGTDAQRLYTETEGNPLFIVEALRAGWPVGRPLSPRVQAVIEARLAALSEPARDLVGVAAAIGRAFSTEVLAAATDAGEDTLVRSLDELWRRRIIREQAAEGYDFSHDKIRQVAYLGLSPARRRQLHLRIVAALEQVGAASPRRRSPRSTRGAAPPRRRSPGIAVPRRRLSCCTRTTRRPACWSGRWDRCARCPALPVSQTATALSGYVAVLDGDVDSGIARIRDAIQQARESSAPGHRAVLGRILLAACVASGDQRAALAAADRLLDMGGAACVWAPLTRRVRAETVDADG